MNGGLASTELLAGFFELCHRCLLNCPAVLIDGDHFPTIISCATEGITACQGERESTRAALVLLTLLFGWRAASVSASMREYLTGTEVRIDQLLAQIGGMVTAGCIRTLTGGSQMLWPPCTDCLFAVLTSGPATVPTQEASSTVGRQWLELSRPQGTDERLFRQVVSIFFDVAGGGGSKNKAKARMLLDDFGRIHAGEMSVDSLITYSYS
jgi:hypothetical protein